MLQVTGPYCQFLSIGCLNRLCILQQVLLVLSIHPWIGTTFNADNLIGDTKPLIAQYSMTETPVGLVKGMKNTVSKINTWGGGSAIARVIG